MSKLGTPGERLLGGAWRVAYGSVLSRIISLGVSVLCARLLTDELFGGFGIVQSTLGLLGLAAGLSLGMAATKFVAQYRRSDPDRANRIGALILAAVFFSSLLVGIVLLAMSGWIAADVLGQPQLEGALAWGAMLLVSSTCFGVTGGILSGTEDFAVVAKASILQQLSTLLLSALLAPSLSLNGVVIAYALGAAAATAYSLWRLRYLFRGLSPRILRRAFSDEMPEIMRFCVPVLGAGLILLPAIWACLRGMGMEASGLVEVAAYTASERIRTVLQFAASFVSTALLPIFADARGRAGGGAGSGAREIELAVSANAILILPLVAILAFGSEMVMGLFGPSYAAFWQVAVVQIGVGAIGALGGAVGVALIAGNMQWFHLLAHSTSGVALFVIFFVLTGKDALGLSLAYLVSTLGLGLWSIPVLHRRGLVTRRTLRTFLGAMGVIIALCGAAVFCPGNIRPLVGVLLAAALLVVAPIVFMSKAELRRTRTVMAMGLKAAMRRR